jgi:hypothetical protein
MVVHPPLTALRLDDEQTTLYSRGSVDLFRTYPGMEVPNPLAQRRDTPAWNLLIKETQAQDVRRRSTLGSAGHLNSLLVRPTLSRRMIRGPS